MTQQGHGPARGRDVAMAPLFLDKKAGILPTAPCAVSKLYTSRGIITHYCCHFKFYTRSERDEWKGKQLGYLLEKRACQLQTKAESDGDA